MILLIDDDPSFACDLATLLGPCTELIWANRSSTGLALIRGMGPVHILLGLDLPHELAELDEVEGIEVLRRLSPAERSRVIVVTSSLPESIRELLPGLQLQAIHAKPEGLARLHEMLVASR